MTNNEKVLMKRQQNILGWLCILLPILSVGLASIGRNVPGWYESISATYYTNSKMFLIKSIINGRQPFINPTTTRSFPS